ncbi:MAG: sialate O-acetylesterase [Verrucomicrobiales bacterium]
MKILTPLLLTALALPAAAELKLSKLFSDHMVIQRDLPIRIWGWDHAGQTVTASFSGSSASTTATGENGRWELTLPARPASAEPATLTISGSSETSVNDILVGEVWLCSGQSNMRFPMAKSTGADLDLLVENHPAIRLLKLPNVASQQPLDDFNASWTPATDTTAIADFSAVGYYYGRILEENLGVPVGLIDNSWGGSAAEAWLRRDVFDADPRNSEQIDYWRKIETTIPQREAAHQKRLASFHAEKQAAEQAGKRFTRKAPKGPQAMLNSQRRPGNLYGGMLRPLIGYGIRGVIWYQGEANSSRAGNYATLFPSMINHWRAEWNQGDFPFYWAQLADYQAESPQPPALQDAKWAALRDAQTATLSLPHTGQAVIITSGETNDIHPTDKLTVARRLARHALNKTYGFDQLVCESPRYQSHKAENGKITVTFETFGSKLDTADVHHVVGFAIAGDDLNWKWAKGKLKGKNQVEVSNPDIPNPVHVRYAWANNPVCNLQNPEGLPATPFRTDK